MSVFWILLLSVWLINKLLPEHPANTHSNASNSASEELLHKMESDIRLKYGGR